MSYSCGWRQMWDAAQSFPAFLDSLLSCALQTGTFDSKEGEFEFIYKSKMHQNRRRFVL